MKKSLLSLPLVFLGISLLTGCSLKEKVRLTYGSMIEDDLISLNLFSDLQKKMSGTEKGENFLLATYLEGGVCSCWDNFEKVLKRYISEENVVIYKISNDLFDSTNKSDLSSWGLTKISGTTPSLAIIKDGKVKKEFIADNSDFFDRYITFKETIDQYVLKPNFYFVDQDIFDDVIANDDKALVQYTWDFCPDCQYLFPSVMFPYSNKHNFKLKLYIIDIGRLTGYDPESNKPFENFDTANEEYATFLREHHMSFAGNEIYGYDRGFVPTTQYWENGVLKDANVYFNDGLTLVEDKWTVTSSFFTQERKESLHYLKGVKTTVIQDLVVDAEDVDIDNKHPAIGSWKKSSAAVYHNPLLTAFFDTYAL